MFQQIIADEEPRDSLREIIAVLRASSNTAQVGGSISFLP